MTKSRTLADKLFLSTAILLLAAGVLLCTQSDVVKAQTTTNRYFNGRVAFNTNRDGNNEIYTMNADGSDSINLTNNPGEDLSPSWSPNGTKIAFYSNRDGDYDIYTMNADGSGLINVTNNAIADGSPAWSPDGTRIAFIKNTASPTDLFSASNEIYTMNANGSGQTNITNNSTYENSPAWSPDGTKIAFSDTRNPNSEVYVANANGSNPINLTNNPAEDYYTTWSPDGTKIAFISYRATGDAELYSMDANGANPTRLTHTVVQQEDYPDWSPDGTKIVVAIFADINYASSRLYIMNPDGTGPTPVTPINSNAGNPNWQPLPYTETLNDDGSKTSTISSSENYPTTDYTVANNETLSLDGSLCDVTVASGGVLMGTGHACTITVNTGGTIAPGHSLGCITTGNLSLSGTYIAQLGGTTACTGYDQLQVTGTVTVSGTLTPSLVNGFTPTNGTTFTLISNDSTDPVSGTFTGQAEGSTLTAGGVVYKISYLGGDGNDVTLTALNIPTAPSTGLYLIEGHLPLVLLVVSAMAASGLIVVVRRLTYQIGANSP